MVNSLKSVKYLILRANLNLHDRTGYVPVLTNKMEVLQRTERNELSGSIINQPVNGFRSTNATFSNNFSNIYIHNLHISLMNFHLPLPIRKLFNCINLLLPDWIKMILANYLVAAVEVVLTKGIRVRKLKF